MLKRHPFWVHYFWSYLLPSAFVAMMFYFPAPLYWTHGGPFDFTQLLQTTVQKSGVHMRGGALIPMLRAVKSETVLVIIVLFSATPAVVALVLAPLTYGKKGLTTLLSRLRPWRKPVSAAEGLKVWSFSILFVIATNLLAYLLLNLISRKAGTISWNHDLLSVAFFWLLLEAMFTNQGGLLEELGWRGYSLPILQERMSPLRATLLLGFCWALWHIPRDVAFHSIGKMGLPVYLSVYLPMFTAWCIGGSIIMTYFFNRTGGSALIAISIHGLLNDSAGFTGRLIGGDFVHSMLPRTISVVVAAAALLILAGPKLGLRPELQETPPLETLPLSRPEPA